MWEVATTLVLGLFTLVILGINVWLNFFDELWAGGFSVLLSIVILMFVRFTDAITLGVPEAARLVALTNQSYLIAGYVVYFIIGLQFIILVGMIWKMLMSVKDSYSRSLR